MTFHRPRLLLAACLLLSLPALAQSYQSRFEQVKFDREGAGGSKTGVVTIDGATGAASVDMPLGPGIGEGALRFTPALRMRSNALTWTRTDITDPNAYMWTPPFLNQDPSQTLDAVAMFAIQAQTSTAYFCSGGTANFSPGSLDLVIPDNRNHIYSSVSYPDGSSSTLGGAVYPGQAAPGGFIPAGDTPDGAKDPSAILDAFHHGAGNGWTLAKFPFYVDTYNGVVTQVPTVQSDFVTVGANGELVVGLQSASAPVVGAPEQDMPTHVVQLPRCILVIRGEVAYEFAYVGITANSQFIPLPRTANGGDGKTKQWLASGHYLLTKMLDRFGNSIVFDHGLDLIGTSTSGVAANGFDYKATWYHQGAEAANVSVSFKTTFSVSGYPILGASTSATTANRAEIAYSVPGLPASQTPDFALEFYYADGGSLPMLAPADWSYYQAGMDESKWDSASHNFLPISVTDQSTKGKVTFSYGFAVFGPNGAMRNNFFLHGGATAGSAGCIDLWTHAPSFFQVFNQQQAPVPLFVGYGQ